MTYMDIFGDALLDYWQDKISQNIITHSSLEEQDIIPIDYLFRSYKNMPELEQKALSFCKGSILDIAAGAGSHSLYLQEKGYKVTAIDRDWTGWNTPRPRCFFRPPKVFIKQRRANTH
jgi:2-polyprenyl-3-methyl-5-hydroxy-6-metoxy-1,4-benzoquinol methylase